MSPKMCAADAEMGWKRQREKSGGWEGEKGKYTDWRETEVMEKENNIQLINFMITFQYISETETEVIELHKGKLLHHEWSIIGAPEWNHSDI